MIIIENFAKIAEYHQILTFCAPFFSLVWNARDFIFADSVLLRKFYGHKVLFFDCSTGSMRIGSMTIVNYQWLSLESLPMIAEYHRILTFCAPFFSLIWNARDFIFADSVVLRKFYGQKFLFFDCPTGCMRNLLDDNCEYVDFIPWQSFLALLASDCEKNIMDASWFESSQNHFYDQWRVSNSTKTFLIHKNCIKSTTLLGNERAFPSSGPSRPLRNG